MSTGVHLVRPNFLARAFTTSRASAGWALDGTLLCAYGDNVPRLTSGGLTVEGQATNLIWPNRDLTHANWSKSGITAVLDATGIDGVASTASRLTCTSAFGQVGEYGATSVAGSHAHSIFMRRRTGTGPVHLNVGRTTGGSSIGPNLVLNGDFGSATGWTLPSAVSITGGALVRSGGPSSFRACVPTLNSPLVPGAAYEVTFSVLALGGTPGTVTVTVTGGTAQALTTRSTLGTFTEIFVAQAGATGIQISLDGPSSNTTVDDFELRPYCEASITLTSEWQRITPAAVTTPAIAPNPAMMVVMETINDEVDVDVVGAEAGTFPTSPIITTSGAVTRLRDAISGPPATFNTAGGGAFFGRVTIPSLVTGVLLGMNDGTNSNRWLVEANVSGLFNINRVNAGVSSTTTNAAGQSYTASVSFGIAIRFASDGIISLSVNGANHAVRSGAPLPPVYNNIIIGETMRGIWGQLRFRPGIVSDAELRDLSSFAF